MTKAISINEFKANKESALAFIAEVIRSNLTFEYQDNYYFFDGYVDGGYIKFVSDEANFGNDFDTNMAVSDDAERINVTADCRYFNEFDFIVKASKILGEELPDIKEYIDDDDIDEYDLFNAEGDYYYDCIECVHKYGGDMLYVFENNEIFAEKFIEIVEEIYDAIIAEIE